MTVFLQTHDRLISWSLSSRVSSALFDAIESGNQLAELLSLGNLKTVYKDEARNDAFGAAYALMRQKHFVDVELVKRAGGLLFLQRDLTLEHLRGLGAQFVE